MGDLTTIQTIIIAIVEGLTEFLPVSSTGHMIITQALLGVESTEFVKAFTVIIQFGAILSVVCLYWKRFFRLNHTPLPEGASPLKRFLHKFDFYWKLLVAFIPAAVLGLLFSDEIDALLESVVVVAVMLVIGGIFMLFCDRIFSKSDTGCFAFNGYYRGWNGPEDDTKGCCRIFFLSGCSYYVCSYRIQGAETLFGWRNRSINEQYVCLDHW